MWRYRWFRWYQVCLLNCTQIRWCIIETSSGLPRKSSAIFGNLRTSSEILVNSRKMFGTFVWPSEQLWKIFGKWSEIFGKSSKTPLSVCLYNKKIVTRWLEDMNFMFSRTISHSFAALTREMLFLPLEHKIHIFSLPCNILYILQVWVSPKL